MTEDIIKLSPSNKHIGSCPECGKSIWESDKIQEESVYSMAVYRCIECKQFIIKERIIPF